MKQIGVALFETNLRTNLLALLLFSLVLCSSLPANNRSGSEDSANQNGLAALPAEMQKSINQGTLAGVVMLVAQDGKVLTLNAVGYRTLKQKKPMRTNTIFDIRSITKPVTAIATMILIEEGKLMLDDPVAKYLPEFGTSPRRKKITIFHLLTHTSGLPLYRLPESEEIATKRNRTLVEYVSFLSKQEPEYEPGSQFRYCSGGFAILGRVIEVISRQPFEHFVKQRVFDPLGMKDSSFYVPQNKRDRLAAIYRLQDGKLNRWVELESDSLKAVYPGPEFGMYSTASDLAALCQMMLDGGTYKGRRILSRASVVRMTQNQISGITSAVTKTAVYQGLGWGLASGTAEDFPGVSQGSFGHNGAFGSIIWIDPTKRLIRIFLNHRFGAGNEINNFLTITGSAQN